MSRYHKEFKFNNGIHELLLPDIHKYLLDEGYDYRVFEGENVYKKGSGWATAPTFVKITASTTVIIVEAWIKTAIFPGVYVGESGLDGFYGSVPKGVLRNRVDHIERMITNNGGVEVSVNGRPAPTQPRVQQNTNVFCTQCGAKSESNAKFCVKCGKKPVK